MIKFHHTNVCLQKFIAKNLFINLCLDDSFYFSVSEPEWNTSLLLLLMLWCCWLQGEVSRVQINISLVYSSSAKWSSSAELLRVSSKLTSFTLVQGLSEYLEKATFLQTEKDLNTNHLIHLTFSLMLIVSNQNFYTEYHHCYICPESSLV